MMIWEDVPGQYPAFNRVSQEILAVPPIVDYGERYCTIGRTFKLAFSLT